MCVRWAHLLGVLNVCFQIDSFDDDGWGATGGSTGTAGGSVAGGPLGGVGADVGGGGAAEQVSGLAPPACCLLLVSRHLRLATCCLLLVLACVLVASLPLINLRLATCWPELKSTRIPTANQQVATCPFHRSCGCSTLAVHSGAQAQRSHPRRQQARADRLSPPRGAGHLPALTLGSASC